MGVDNEDRMDSGDVQQASTVGTGWGWQRAAPTAHCCAQSTFLISSSHNESLKLKLTQLLFSASLLLYGKISCFDMPSKELNSIF